MGSTGDMPESIAGYRVLAELGAGGMGTVYLVQHPRIGRLEALKVISPQLSSDPEFRARFLREADLAASVEASGIVPVYDRDEVDGRLYLTMRWIDGTDLAHLLRASPRPPVEQAMTGLAQVANALDAVHRAGLVHRDVKPSNVLIARGRFEPPPGGEVQWFLTDFGIARRLDQETDLTGRAFLGTVPYTAPERFSGAPATPASDIYAFGCLAYEVLLGHPPFGRTAGQVLGAHAQGQPPHDEVLTPAMRAALRAGLASRPENRPRTASELVRSMRRADPGALPPPRALDPGGEPATLPPTGAVAATVAARPRRPGRPARIARTAAVALLAAACLTGSQAVAVGPGAPGSAEPLPRVPLPGGTEPRRVVVDPDGDAWIDDSSSERITRVSPRGSVREYLIPPSPRATTSDLRDLGDPKNLAIASDGTPWFTDVDWVGYVERSGDVRVFASPSGLATGEIAPTGDGGMWMAGGLARLGRVSRSGEFSSVDLSDVAAEAAVIDVAASSDGGVWFTAFGGDSSVAGRWVIGRYDADSGVTTFDVAPPEGYDSLQRTDLVVDDAGVGWLATTGAVYRLEPDGTVEAVPLLSNRRRGVMEQLAFGPDDDLYWLDEVTGRIGKYDPRRPDEHPEFLVLHGEGVIRGMAATDDRLWFTAELDNGAPYALTASGAGQRVDPRATQAMREDFNAALAVFARARQDCLDTYDHLGSAGSAHSFWTCFGDAAEQRDAALQAIDFPPIAGRARDDALEASAQSIEAIRELEPPAEPAAVNPYDTGALLGQATSAVAAGLDQLRTALGVPRTGTYY